MALRDQPYLPLYVQDYLTDEKLNMCSPSAQGVYIKIMCVLHKQATYGEIILFKQKDKQKPSMIENFALRFTKLLPFTYEDIFNALQELIEEGVLIIEADKIMQPRMVKDNRISETRSLAAKKGGGNPNLFKQNNKQKDKQNPENENEYINEYNNEDIGGVGEKDSEHEQNTIGPRNPMPSSHSIHIREQLFIAECNSFANRYPESMVKDFIRYWTEPNKSKTKMRYEVERTWDTARRLITWENNDQKFNGNGSKQGNTAVSRLASSGTRKTTI